MEGHHAEMPKPESGNRGSWLVGFTSFLFVLLQSACTAVMAISGLRLLIGLTSLAAASILPGFILAIHAERIRVPMMVTTAIIAVPTGIKADHMTARWRR